MTKAGMAGWWRWSRRTAIVVLIVMSVIVLIALLNPHPIVIGPQVPFSSFLTDVSAGRVRDVVIQGHTITGQLTNDRVFATYMPTDANFVVQRLVENGVRIVAKPEDTDVNPLLHYILAWLPLILWVLALRFVGVRVKPGTERAVTRRIADLETRLQNLEGLSR